MNDHIYDFWNKQGEVYKKSHVASWGDTLAIDLEIDNISRFINNGDKVLDIGCANGYSTFFYLKKEPKHITGIDFSESMIKYAKDRAEELKVESKVNFQIGDVRKLEFDDNSFDLSYTTRVLINLSTWEEQKKGIDESIRVTKKGGKIIFSEAFYEPQVLINSLRQLVNLPPLYEHDFNRYLNNSTIEWE